MVCYGVRAESFSTLWITCYMNMVNLNMHSRKYNGIGRVLVETVIVFLKIVHFIPSKFLRYRGQPRPE